MSDDWNEGEWWREPWWRDAVYQEAARAAPGDVDAAFDALRTIFSADWVRRTLERREEHLLRYTLYQQGLLPFRSLYPLGRDIIAVNGCSGFRSLVRRLHKARTFLAARSELVVAAVLARRRFTISLEPGARGTRRPDLLAVRDDVTTCIEVKMLGESQADVCVSRLTQELAFLFPKLPKELTCEIEVAVEVWDQFGSDPVGNERFHVSLVGQIGEMLRAAVNGPLPFQFTLPRVAYVHLYRDGRPGTSSVRGPLITEEDEMRRLVRNALLGASEQLPNDAPGVVLIGLRFLPEVAFAREVLDGYFKERTRFGHISGVVLTTAYQFAEDGSRRLGSLFENRHAAVPLTRLPVHAAFIEWLQPFG